MKVHNDESGKGIIGSVVLFSVLWFVIDMFGRILVWMFGLKF